MNLKTTLNMILPVIHLNGTSPTALYERDETETPRSLAVNAGSALFEELNRKYGVLEKVDDLRGWHLVEAELRKPGVYRIVTSRYTQGGAELRHGFASQQIITTARELGYLSAPNGFTMPNHRDEPRSPERTPTL